MPLITMTMGSQFETLSRINQSQADEINAKTSLHLKAGKIRLAKTPRTVVKLARNTETGAIIALKKMRCAANKNLLHRALAEIDHYQAIGVSPGLAHMLDYIDVISKKDDVDQHTVYIALPLATAGDGVKRIEYLRKVAHIDIAIAEKWLQETFYHYAAAIAQLHEINGFSHRDVKPNNFLHYLNGTIELNDFEFLQSDTKDEIYTFTHAGTDGYKPPEFYDEKNYSGKAHDCFALGITYLKMRKALFRSLAVAKKDDYVYLKNIKFEIHTNRNRIFDGLDSKHAALQDLKFEQEDEIMAGLILDDPKKRLTAVQVVQSPYFAKLAEKFDSPFLIKTHKKSLGKIRNLNAFNTTDLRLTFKASKIKSIPTPEINIEDHTDSISNLNINSESKIDWQFEEGVFGTYSYT